MRFWGALAFVVPFGIYVASLSAYVNAWDTAEFQTVPYILGIAHPTGFPAYVLLGWLFSHAVAISTVAWRMSLLSAACAAAAAAILFVIAMRLGVPPPGAFGAAVLFALGNVVWTRGTRAEVHTLATLEALVAAMAALCWYQDRRARWLWICALAIGFGLATHPTIVLVLPGICLLIVAARRMPSPGLAALCAAAVLLPLLCYAYIPLRSAYVTAHRIDPTLSLGIPPGRPYWDYGNPSSVKAFLRYVSGSDFRAPSSVVSLFDPASYVAVAPRVWAAATEEFSLTALALAAIGVGALVRRDVVQPVALALALFAAVPFVYNYAAEADSERYAMPGFALIAAFAACGATAIATLLSGSDRRARDATVFGAMLLIAIAEFWSHRSTFDQRFDRRFANYVDRVRETTPDASVIVADWTYATPLAYAAYVERSMGRRIVETAHPSDDAKYLEVWAKRRPVFVVSPSDLMIPGVPLVRRSAEGPQLFQVERR